MTPKKIIYQAMEETKLNQTALASAAGFKRQTNVSEILRSENMRTDNFIKLLNAMGYDLVVVKHGTEKLSWVVDNSETL